MSIKIKGEFPDYNEKQKLLYGKSAAPEELIEIADRLLAAGRFSEAYDFIKQSNDEKRMEKFMDDASARGDFFNFERAALVLDMEVPPELWDELADNAIKAGLIINAIEAYRRAGNKQKAEALIEKYPDFFAPVLEMEKAPAARKVKPATVETGHKDSTET